MITIVGAGFAGVEAAWAAASLGVPVRLYEMRPAKTTPAHTTAHFAELVCSNSLKSKLPTSPAGQLKAEMAGLGSIVLKTAEAHSVPGGQALAVDRDAFGAAITAIVQGHPLIEVVREEVTPAMAELALESAAVVLATGPLTSPELAAWLAEITGRAHLYFYDAVSPTVDASSLDYEVVFAQSRYDKGEGDDYLNCPFDRASYEAFVRELATDERAPLHAFEAGGRRDAPGDSNGEAEFIERVQYFSGCTPIEVIAEKGARSLAFGNFKPVGLTDPRTGRRPWAALQLRPENRERTLYSLVACQTRLKWGEQKRVFQMVPGLQHAEFVRYGVIHRNTYLEAPRVLTPRLTLRPELRPSRHRAELIVAGQLTGVEGYVESAALGLYAGLLTARAALGVGTPPPPRATAYGSLLAHLQDATPREFSPMNINWGLFPEPVEPSRDKGVKRELKIAAARAAFEDWKRSLS